jgi:heme/copper-type cytochrome/quinol oxidase subunit 1
VFPRAGAAAFWTWLVGSGMLIASFATDGGLGELTDGATRPDAVALTLASLGLVVVALLLASVCVATTVIAARTSGMTLRRVPLFSWSMLVATSVWIASLPVLLAGIVLAFVDYRHGQLLFGLPGAVNQQLAWAFWPPQVFAYAIPVVGIMSEIVPVAARVRQRMHDVLLVGIALFGLLSFGAWAMQFEVQDNFLYPAFAFALLVPVLILFGGWADSLRQGKPSSKGPVGALLLATVGSLLLVAGVVCAALRAVDGLDLLSTSATDGVFELALLCAVAGAFAGVVFWSAKLTGHLYPEGIARAVALPLLGGIALVGIPQLIAGFLDQPAGIVQGSVKDGVQVLDVLSVIGICLVALAVLGFVAGAVKVLAAGGKYASNNPWQAHTLEWSTVSPPPIGNFTEPVPLVRSERPLLDPVVDDASTGGAA